VTHCRRPIADALLPVLDAGPILTRLGELLLLSSSESERVLDYPAVDARADEASAALRTLGLCKDAVIASRRLALTWVRRSSARALE